MKSLLVTGRCPYNLHQQQSLCDLGVDAALYENWGMYLPEHVDAILSAKPDIIHLQWPESLIRRKDLDEAQALSDFATALPRLKSEGAKLFWTMHNLLPHEKSMREFWRALYQLFADHCDVCCHHSIIGRQRVLDAYRFADAQHVVLRHGYFHGDVHPALSQATARVKYGLPSDARIFLNVGSLRPDKCISELLDCFAGRDSHRDVLVLAGTVQGDYGAAQAARVESMDNVFLYPGYIENEIVSRLANAADCFLFMQGESHLTSGAPHLSQAHLLPQITLDYGYAREVLGDSAVYIPADDQRYLRLSAIVDEMELATLQKYRDEISVSRELWRWDVIGAETKQVYMEALGRA